MSQRILITGAGGFVGAHLIKALQSRGDAEIYAAVFHATSDLVGMLPASHILDGDLTNYGYAESLVQHADPVVTFHLAAMAVVHTSAEQATRVLSANMTLQYNILEAIRLHAPKSRFVAIASANAYGSVQNQGLPVDESTPLRPLNPYAVSKVAQEMLALQYHLAHGLDVVILRPFNHTGVGQTTDFVIPALVRQVVEIERGMREPILHVGNLTAVRDFTDVDDMVAAYLLAADKGKSGEIYNIGTGVGHTIQAIVTQLLSLSNVKITVASDPARVRAADVPVLIANADKFKTLTGWAPTIPLNDTIRRILESERKQSL